MSKEIGRHNKTQRLVFITEPLIGGVGRHITDLLSAFAYENYDLHLIYGNRNDAKFENCKPQLEKLGVTFHHISSLQREVRFTYDSRAFISLLMLLRKLRPDIVHCFSSKAGFLGRTAAYLAGVQRIYYKPAGYAGILSSGKNSLRGRFYLFCEKMLGGCTTKIVNVSQGERRFALEYRLAPTHKLVVIHNGIDLTVQHEKHASTDYLTVGMVCRLDTPKDPLQFVDIAARVIDSIPRVRFVCVGDGPLLSKTKEYARVLNIYDRIEFTGFLIDPTSVMHRFDICISTSAHEGLPHSLIEAAALGLPIVATDVVGNNEVVYHNVNGLLFPYGDADTGARYIISLVSDDEARDRMSLESRKIYDNKFTRKRMVNLLLQIYNDRK